MAAAEAWRAHVGELVADAAGSCSRAYATLADAAGRLESPMRAAGVDSGSDLAVVAAVEELLEAASGDLASAASIIGAAELLALGGAAATPEAPLRSAEDVVADPDLRLALDELRKARARAVKAHGAAECGRGHLWSAKQLLGYPRLRAVFPNAALNVARRAFDDARGFARKSAALARAAHLLLLP